MEFECDDVILVVNYIDLVVFIFCVVELVDCCFVGMCLVGVVGGVEEFD